MEVVDSKKLHTHLNFITEDFLHAERLSTQQPRHSPTCKLCIAPVENTELKSGKELNLKIKYCPAGSIILSCPTNSQLTQQDLIFTGFQPSLSRLSLVNPHLTWQLLKFLYYTGGEVYGVSEAIKMTFFGYIWKF